MTSTPSAQSIKKSFVQALVSQAVPIPSVNDLRSLSDYLVNYPVVLMGEASHGTSDFYRIRQHLSRDLILRQHPTTKFRFIAVEGDWPSCYAIHRYITDGVGQSARAVLEKEFTRWPTWMWANEEMVDFFEWLKEHNGGLPPHEKVGFFGLDVYSLYESITAVVNELQKVDPKLAEQARSHFACFDRIADGDGDGKRYGRSLLLHPQGCKDAVIAVLRELLGRRMPEHDGQDAHDPDSHIFNARQNALVVRGAETYYRTMVLGDGQSWNVRDYHMADTLQRLLNAYTSVSQKRVQELGRTEKQVGCIVWEHNTHVGDHRYSTMALRNRITIGGVLRERLGEDRVCLLGFGTHRGTVIAARNKWGGRSLALAVPPAVAGSFDNLMHQVCQEKKAPVWYAIFRTEDIATSAGWKMEEGSSQHREAGGPSARVDFRKQFGDLRAGQRAMGVVYDPEFEMGNYVPCEIVMRYDALVFVDVSKALNPLATKADESKVPETYPTGV